MAIDKKYLGCLKQPTDEDTFFEKDTSSEPSSDARANVRLGSRTRDVRHKYKPGKFKRHKRKMLKLGKEGFGKPWSADYLIFRVEWVWENSLGEQANFQLHWIQVRKLKGEERRFAISYMEKNYSPLALGELPEYRYLLCYLDNYYSNKKEVLKANHAFVYPATKRGDKAIREPIFIRKFNKDTFVEYPFNAAIAAVFQNTIFHQIES